MVSRFPGVPDAATRLQELGWSTAFYRHFACDPLPASETNWLDMSVHLFADEASASAAIPFFSYARTVGTQLGPVPAMSLGDSTAAISGPSENGTEYTLYLSTGRLLFRVSAVAAQGAPQADVEYVMTSLFTNALNIGVPAAPQAHNVGAISQDPEATTAGGEEPLSVVTPTVASTEQGEGPPIMLASDCMTTPSQCSLQDGVPDWTTPAYGCDWNYGTSREGCVPDQQGDFDCDALYAMDLARIHVIGDDWMLLDDDGDGIGCENPPLTEEERVYGVTSEVEPAAPAPELVQQSCLLSIGSLSVGCSATEVAAAPIAAPTAVSDYVYVSAQEREDCMNAPSRCSLIVPESGGWGTPDWTTPAYGCDWNYAMKMNGGCIPSEQGDLDCVDVYALGIFFIHIIGEDWMLLDEDGDGIGCQNPPPYFGDPDGAHCASLAQPDQDQCFEALVQDDRYDDPGYDDRDYVDENEWRDADEARADCDYRCVP